MRTTRNWGMIRTGETFEALATALLFFEDSGARLFGARGADGGQDARSGDDKTVFQAKHHIKPTAAKALSDAKRELEKIARYRAVGHARNAEWTGVEHWTLVTNASFNPTDTKTWHNEVAPEFAKLGLAAGYWEEATLDSYLDKHPEVDRAFFQNENRVFLSPAEARLRVADDDPFTQRADLGPYVERQSAQAALDAFLAGDKMYLSLHAAGGIGKTRFLLESACRISAKGEWQALWANVRSMEMSSTWFDAVVPERPTLLVVDEPDDERLIHRLQEQLGRRVGRAQRWKIVIAVRSTKDPILRALQHPRIKRWVDELRLIPLAPPECEEMCSKLLETGKLANADATWRSDTAKKLARRFDGYPIWLSLAVHLLEEEGSLANLPDTAGGLCRLYLDEAFKLGRPNDKLLELVRWVALLGPINREEESELQHLAERGGCASLQEVREALMRLASARLLRSWGARDRLVDVKPDVLRDFILRAWFCEERDYGEYRHAPSQAATTLTAELSKSLVEGTAGKREERVLVAFARVDFLLRYSNGPADLGAPVFAAINEALSSMTPSQRIAMVAKMGTVGAYYPEEIVSILRRLRLERAADETVKGYWTDHTYSQSDVVLELAHAHHKVARGILTDEQSARVFEELYALILEEKRLEPTLRHGLPNDGKRAEGVIRNLLEGGPSYYREFGEVAAELVLRELTNNAENGVQIDKLTALQSVVRPLCDVQRHQTWSDGPTFHLQTQLLSESHPNREGGRRVLARIRSILEDGAAAFDDESRVLLWNMVSEAHRQANFAKGQLTDDAHPFLSDLNARLLEDLKWVRRILELRTPSPRELRAARKVWGWHAEFGKDDEATSLAKDLEAAYMSQPAIKLFEGLTDWNSIEETQRQVDAKANELASAGTEAIEDFLKQAVAFLGKEDMRRLLLLADALGRLATENGVVRKFFRDGLQRNPLRGAAYQFVMSGIRSWVYAERRDNQRATPELVAELLALGTPEKKLDLLKTLYIVPYCRDEALLNSTAELDLVRQRVSLFVEAKCVQEYIACTLWGLRHDWPGLRARIEEAIAGAGSNERRYVTARLIELLHEVLASQTGTKLPTDLLSWLWNRLIETADLGFIEHEGKWYLDEILKKLGKVPMPSLVDAVRRRALRHSQTSDLVFYPPCDLIALVQVVDANNVSEPEVQAALGELTALLGESSLMANWLPELLARVDPQGLEIPRRLAKLIEAESEPHKVRKLVRAACYYGVGTPPWRQTARAAFKAAQTMSQEERVDLYDSSSETGRLSWSAAAGTVAKIFVDAVAAAKRGVQEEQEREFVPFWEWRLQSTEEELRRRQERLKEEVWD